MNAESKALSPTRPGANEAYRRWLAWAAKPDDSRRDPLGLVWTLCLVLATAIAVRTVVRPSSHTVFPIFAASAQHWWGNQALYQDDPTLDNFRYPPVFAVLVTPFAALGLIAGGILWSWVSLAVYAAGLGRFVRDVAPSAWTRGGIALFFLLAILGALRGLWNAQSNALIVGLLLLGAAALVRAIEGDGRAGSSHRWWWAALLLALPVALKLTPLVLVALLCALWPRRLLGRFVVLTALLALVPFLTRPPAVVLEHYGEWIDHLLESGDARWLGFRDGWTVCLVLRHFFSGTSGLLSLREPVDSSWYRVVQVTTGVAVLLWCLWQRRRAASGSRWLVHVTMAMGTAWLMLFGPAVEHATYVFLAPALAWAVLERRAWPRGRGPILAAFALIMVLGWGAVGRWLSTWPILLAALPVGTSLFALWLIGYARHTEFVQMNPSTIRMRPRGCLRKEGRVGGGIAGRLESR